MKKNCTKNENTYYSYGFTSIQLHHANKLAIKVKNIELNDNFPLWITQVKIIASDKSKCEDDALHRWKDETSFIVNT